MTCRQLMKTMRMKVKLRHSSRDSGESSKIKRIGELVLAWAIQCPYNTSHFEFDDLF